MDDEEFKIKEEPGFRTLLEEIERVAREVAGEEEEEEEPEDGASDRMRNICTGSVAIMRVGDLLDSVNDLLDLNLEELVPAKELSRLRLNASRLVGSLMPVMDALTAKMAGFDEWKGPVEDEGDVHDLRARSSQRHHQGAQKIRHAGGRPGGTGAVECETPQDPEVPRRKGRMKHLPNPLCLITSDILYTLKGYMILL